MAHIQSLRGKEPSFGPNCWIAPNATIVGDVSLGKDSSVWFQAVLRGDVNPIRIGEACNIQDGALLHCTFKRSTVSIGNHVSIGHHAIIHGCCIQNRVLVGMGAIVMDEAIVEEEALIAAGAVILEGTIVESGYIYAGVPAKKVKKVSKDTREVFMRTARNYIQYADWFREKSNL